MGTLNQILTEIKVLGEHELIPYNTCQTKNYEMSG